MKRILLVVVALLATSCLGPQARQETLLPAAQLAWAEVQVDFQAGVADGLADGELESEEADSLAALAVELSGALDESDLKRIALIQWEASMLPWATRGIDSEVEAGRLGPNGATLLHERLEHFTQALSELRELN